MLYDIPDPKVLEQQRKEAEKRWRIFIVDALLVIMIKVIFNKDKDESTMRIIQEGKDLRDIL